MPQPMTASEIRCKQGLWHDHWVNLAAEMDAWQREIVALHCVHLMDSIRGRVRDGWPTRGETVEECG